MSKAEVFELWKPFESTVQIDSVFRGLREASTRAKLDELLRQHVDTLIVYSIWYVGAQVIIEDSCSNTKPIDSYFLQLKNAVQKITRIDGTCSGDQIIKTDAFQFMSDNFSLISKEFFMPAIQSAVKNGDRVRIKEAANPHDPIHKLVIMLGNKCKVLTFRSRDLSDTKSLFYDDNRNLRSFRLLELVNEQINLN